MSEQPGPADGARTMPSRSVPGADCDATRDVHEPVFVEIARGDVHWRFDREFLTSNWTCLFGNGCKGILDHDAEELGHGCCSLGAHFGDGPAGVDESMQISAMAALLTPDQWQYHAIGTTPWRPGESGRADDRAVRTAGVAGAEEGARASADDAEVAGYFGDTGRTHTRVVDDACVFLNRPGFAGGAGCALHIAALEADESPIDWKPSVCWQLPIRVDWALVDPDDPEGPESATVRRWSRDDWGDHGRTMAWCCTERDDGGEAYSGSAPVVETLADELRRISGPDVHDELIRRL